MHLNDVTPMLQARSLEETVDFYTQSLGFSLEGTWPAEGPKVWCSLRAGGASLMFVQADGTTEPSLTGSLYFYPPDLDALWQNLKGRVDGASVAWEPATMEHGMREFGIRDCNGYLLIFGQDA